MTEKPKFRVISDEEWAERSARRAEKDRLSRIAGLAEAEDAVARGERERFDFAEFCRRYKWRSAVARPRAEHEQYWTERYYLDDDFKTIDEYIEYFYKILDYEDPYVPPFAPPRPSVDKESAETEWEATYVFVEHRERVGRLELEINSLLDSAELFPDLNAFFLAEGFTLKGFTKEQTAVVGVDKLLLVAEVGVSFEELLARYNQGERTGPDESPITSDAPRFDLIRSFSDVTSVAQRVLDIPDFRQLGGTTKRLRELSAFYQPEPEPGGKAMIIGYDGSILVSNKSFETHMSKFKKGKRTYAEPPPRRLPGL